MELKRTLIRKKWLILSLLFLALYVAAVVVYFRWGIDYAYLWLTETPTSESEALALQIESSRKELATIPNLVSEREYQFSQAQELLAKEQSRMPDALNINDLVREVLEIANDCHVKVVPLRTTPLASRTTGQPSYSYWEISISVEGDFKNIANFLEDVDGKYISTATVTSTILGQDEENPDSANFTNHNAAVRGTIQLKVYTSS